MNKLCADETFRDYPNWKEFQQRLQEALSSKSMGKQVDEEEGNVDVEKLLTERDVEIDELKKQMRESDEQHEKQKQAVIDAFCTMLDSSPDSSKFVGVGRVFSELCKL